MYKYCYSNEGAIYAKGLLVLCLCSAAYGHACAFDHSLSGPRFRFRSFSRSLPLLIVELNLLYPFC